MTAEPFMHNRLHCVNINLESRRPVEHCNPVCSVLLQIPGAQNWIRHLLGHLKPCRNLHYFFYALKRLTGCRVKFRCFSDECPYRTGRYYLKSICPCCLTFHGILGPCLFIGTVKACNYRYIQHILCSFYFFTVILNFPFKCLFIGHERYRLISRNSISYYRHSWKWIISVYHLLLDRF